MGTDMKAEKFYNPYPFPVRVINDLGKEQFLAPYGGHAKVKDQLYDQSALNLLVYEPEKRVKQKKYTKIDFTVRRLTKPDCVKLVWALGIDEYIEKKTKKELVKMIVEKIEEWVRDEDNV